MSFRGTLWDPLVPALEDSTPTTVDGWLRVPPASAPVPAVVIEHGCGGVRASHHDWAADLADAGIASLVLDSFTGRDLDEICSGRRTVSVASLLVDVYRSADLLRDHPGIDPDRIGVIGFSFGGRTALWAAQERFQDAYGGEPFGAYAAFYPSTCFIQLVSEADVAGGPIGVFHGEADDYTPIDQCRQMIGRMADAGVDATVFAYPGAHHGFDDRALASSVRFYSPGTPSPRNCSFVEVDGEVVDVDSGQPAGVGSRCVERGVTSAYDGNARHQARDDLLTFLVDAFGP